MEGPSIPTAEANQPLCSSSSSTSISWMTELPSGADPSYQMETGMCAHPPTVHLGCTMRDSSICCTVYTTSVCACRTPQGVRSLLVVYVTLVVPIFFGPYYSYVRDDVGSFAYALFLVVVVRSCTVGAISAVPW